MRCILGPNFTLCLIPLSFLSFPHLPVFHLFLLFLSLKTAFNLFWNKGSISSYFHLLTSMLNSKIIPLVTCIFQTLSPYQHLKPSEHPSNTLVYVILCQDLDHSCHTEYHYQYYNIFKLQYYTIYIDLRSIFPASLHTCDLIWFPQQSYEIVTAGITTTVFISRHEENELREGKQLPHIRKVAKL